MDQYRISYPVGSNISEAIEFIDNAFLSIYINELFKDKDINLWCRGSSGAILAGLLSSKFIGMNEYKSIKIIHVKKSGESAHGHDISEFNSDTPAYNIIVDDFCATGETINHISTSMKRCGVHQVNAVIISSMDLKYKVEGIGIKLTKVFPFTAPEMLFIGEHSCSDMFIDFVKEVEPIYF